jgi:Ca2+/Na+ antiporter
MFKAKLIESENYYKTRRNQLLLMLLPSIPIALIINFDMFPLWVTAAMVALYVVFMYFSVKNNKLMEAFTGKKLLEIDDDEIRIMSKEGKQLENFKVEHIDKLYVKSEYGIPQETMTEVAQELKGKLKKNYIIIQKGTVQSRCDFIVDSHYMLVQLGKHIDYWKNKSYNIEMIGAVSD